jgi:maleate isomerase
METQSPHHRIGLLVPSSNTIMEPDFYHNIPAGWTLHTARMFLEDVTPEAEGRMLDEFTLPAARDLATAQPDVIVFGCTSAGALRGNDYDACLIQEITQLTHIPTISVVESVRKILISLNAHRVVVITPYVDGLNERIRASLESDELEIMHIHGLGIVENTQIARVPETKILSLAKEAVGSLQPDALFVSCTNFPVVQVLEKLRTLFSFPVISSNQAALDMAIATVRDLKN